MFGSLTHHRVVCAPPSYVTRQLVTVSEVGRLVRGRTALLVYRMPLTLAGLGKQSCARDVPITEIAPSPWTIHEAWKREFFTRCRTWYCLRTILY